MRDGLPTLSRIRFYPLKGARGLELESTIPDLFGIPGDRRWMLVRPGGRFISQRTHPRIARLRLEPVGSGSSGALFRVWAPGMGSAPLREGTGAEKMMEVRVHQDCLQGRVLVEGGAWFSEFLGETCHLVFIPESVVRPVNSRYAPGHRTSFSDGYPLLVTAEASLDALNLRLPAPVGMNRFRPNLVIAGGAAWEEDQWRVLKVGEARIALVNPCARCAVTKVDQETGAVGQEPLRTLAEIRGWKGKSYFGQNGVFERRGRITVGDRVRIIQRGEPRPPDPS